MNKLKKSVLVLGLLLGASFFATSVMPAPASVSTTAYAVNCGNPPWKANPRSFFSQSYFQQIIQYYQYRINCRSYWQSRQKYRNNQSQLQQKQQQEKTQKQKVVEVSQESGSVVDTTQGGEKVLRVLNKNSTKTYYSPDNTDEEWNLFLKAASTNPDLQIQEQVNCPALTQRCDTSCYYQAREAYTVNVPYNCNCGKSGCQTCYRGETRYRWVTRTDRCNANCGKNSYVPCQCTYSGGAGSDNSACTRTKAHTCNTNCYYTVRVPYNVQVPYSCNCGKNGCGTCYRTETRYRNETRTDRCGGRCSTSEGNYPCGCTTAAYSVWKNYEYIPGEIN